EIQRAYKRLALRYHPDKAGPSESAAEKFKAAAHAYHILNDPERREIYDRYGEDGLVMMEQ
ncbi:DnaJ domain-containing protein, partial [Pavlovales sp. CCMP2436]